MNFFKKITREVSRVAKQVKKEAGRVALKVGAVVGTLPIPALGGLAAGALNTAGALLADKSAKKYLTNIPAATLDSLVRGAQLATNPGSALESIVNTIGTAQEQFAGKVGKVPIAQLRAQIQAFYSSGGIVNGIAGLASGSADGAPVGYPGGEGIAGNGALPGGQHAADLLGGGAVGLANVGAGVVGSGIPSLANVLAGSSGSSPAVRVLLNSAGALAGISLRF